MTQYAEIALVRGMSYLADAQSTIAHNLANVNTKGFKRRTPVAELSAQQFESALGRRMETVRFTQRTDWTPGTTQQTDSNFDVALENGTALRVQNAQGRSFYTVDGHMQLDRDGYLVNSNGLRYLDQAGSPILFDGEDIPPSDLAIQPDGTMLNPQTNQRWGPIGIFRLPKDSAMQPLGQGLYQDVDGRQPELAPGGLQQGYSEASNVDSMQEMVQMMIVQRSFTATQKALSTVGRMQSQLVEHANR